MKKFTALLLALVMVLGLCACGAKNDATTDIPDSTTLLSNVFAQYAEDEKFPIGGGAGDAMVMDAPGALDVADAETMDFMVGLPMDSAAMIDDAASALHMMNANTFTCGVVHLTEGTDAAAFAQVMRDAIQSNRWMCGFPETLTVAVIGGEYVVIAFGVHDAMNPFMTHFAEAFPGAEILFNEAIEG